MAKYASIDADFVPSKVLGCFEVETVLHDWSIEDCEVDFFSVQTYGEKE